MRSKQPCSPTSLLNATFRCPITRELYSLPIPPSAHSYRPTHAMRLRRSSTASFRSLPDIVQIFRKDSARFPSCDLGPIEVAVTRFGAMHNYRPWKWLFVCPPRINNHVTKLQSYHATNCAKKRSVTMRCFLAVASVLQANTTPQTAVASCWWLTATLITPHSNGPQYYYNINNGRASRTTFEESGTLLHLLNQLEIAAATIVNGSKDELRLSCHIGSTN